MKKQQIQSATSLPPSPDQERRGRMIKYSVMMAIRLVCLIVATYLATSLHTWWALVPIAGAIFLPYFAVIIANTVVQPRVTEVERPGSIVLVPRPRSGAEE